MITGIIPHKTNRLNYRGVNLSNIGDIIVQTSVGDDVVINNSEFRFTDYLDGSSIDTIQSIEDNNEGLQQVELNSFCGNISTFIKYSSFLDVISNTIFRIEDIFPAALYSTSRYGLPNIQNINYDNYENETKIHISSNTINNPFGIIYYQTDEINKVPVRNFKKYYKDYDFIINGKSYSIKSVVLSNARQNGHLIITIYGKYTELTQNYEIYIKPKKAYVEEILKKEHVLVKYIFESDFRFYFNTSSIGTNGAKYFYKRYFEMPRFRGDQYNLDFITSRFETFRDDILDFAKKQDEIKYNVYRNYISNESLTKFVEINLEGIEMSKNAFEFVNTYYDVSSYFFDEIYRHTNAIKFNNRINHQKTNTVSSLFLELLTDNLGWNEELISNNDKIYHLAVESAYIHKSKGTRYILEQLMDYFGIPMDLYDLNTFVYKIENKISYDKLVEYVKYISPFYDKTTLPIDKNGNPIILENFNGDLEVYENMLPYVNVTEINSERVVRTIKNLAHKNYDLNNSNVDINPVNQNFSPETCYTGSAIVEEDPYEEIVRDICGCPLPVRDNVYSIDASPINLKNCNGFFADIWYNCIDETQSEVFFNIYGGMPPYNITGVSNGQTITNDTKNSLTIQDSNGCEMSYIIFNSCVDPCIGSNLVATIEYDCLLDDFGDNTGTAQITVSASGGVPPYSFTGVQTNDIVEHGEIITVYVVDSNGCQSETVGVTVNCASPVLPACDDLDLITSLEVKDVDLASKTAIVDFAFGINNIPTGLNINSVEVETTGVGSDNNYLVGSPVTSIFTTLSGADSLLLSFVPDNVKNSITLSHDITINLTNECQYTYSVTLFVNPQNLGDTDNDSATLTP